MFATTLIVFRESLEAALFIGIIAAATRGFAGSRRWLGAGIGMGALGAVILALLAGHISGWLGGLGQDVVNIGVLSLALVMLLWHCVWVTAHAGEMVTEARRLGDSVNSGTRRPWALLVVVALAVMREGAETVLFVSGVAAGNSTLSLWGVLSAGGSGLLAGVLLGLGIYVGLTRIPVRKLFAVTNGLIALFAASIASQLVLALTQAGFIEAWTQPLWDSSRILAPASVAGTLLHALVGYDARPSPAQLAAYLAVLLVIFFGTRPSAEKPRSAA